MCRPSWIEGSATLTIVKSRTTMNCAMDKENSNADPARGAAAGGSLMVLQCRAAVGRRQRPPRCRALAAIVPASLAVVMLAGCTSGTPHPAAEALSAGCSTAVAAGSVQFEVAVSGDDRYVFV